MLSAARNRVEKYLPRLKRILYLQADELNLSLKHKIKIVGAKINKSSGR